MFIFPAQFYSLCLLFFLCEAARWAACLNERGFINVSNWSSSTLISIKRCPKWIEFRCKWSNRCKMMRGNAPRPSMAFLSADTSSSALKLVLSLTVPLVLDWENTHTSKSAAQNPKTRVYSPVQHFIFLLTCPAYRHSEWRRRVQQQVQVILQHTATSIDQHLFF